MLAQSRNTFKSFIPLNVIEKGEVEADGLPKELLISGVASSMASGKYDVDGQILDVTGFDFQPFLRKGFISQEHRGKDDYSYLIGEPTNAFVKGQNFHIEGKLYRDNPKARSIYELATILKKAGSTRKLGYSIEGFVQQKDPKNPGKIAKAVITGVTICTSPKNDGTEVLIKGEGDFTYETQPGTELLIDITQDGVRYTVDKNLELKKSMEAGTVTGRETADKSTSGPGLKEEDIDGVKKKKTYKEKLAAMYKRKGLGKDGECLSKAEALLLLSEIGLDAPSCLNVYRLAEAIQRAGK